KESCSEKPLTTCLSSEGTLVRVVEEVARADGAAGWCVAIGGEYGVFGGYLPPDAAHEIYGSDPLVITGGAFRPAALANSSRMRAKKLSRAAECLVYSLTPSGVLAENHPKIGVSSASCGVKNAQGDVFHGDLPLESGLAARARCLGFGRASRRSAGRA